MSIADARRDLPSSYCSVACDSGQAIKTERLWKEFILDPSQWWDNRLAKVQCLHSERKSLSREGCIFDWDVDQVL